MARLRVRHTVLRAGALMALLLVMLVLLPAAATALTSTETLGKYLYFDTRLSTPDGQACAGCHAPAAGWADPDQTLPVSKGVVAGRYGNRNSPMASYAAYSPAFGWNSMKGVYQGGQFWDGRASDLVAQAKGPFLNPLEMNNPSKAAVVDDVRSGSYATLFRSVYGAASLDDPAVAYDKIAAAIAAYEKSTEVNAFTSKYDAYMAGRASFTTQERQGLSLFKCKGGCSSCHTAGMGGCCGGGGMGGMGGGGCGMGGMSGSSKALFTDFSYRNIGVPRNPSLPFYTELEFNPQGPAWVDLGLGGVIGDARQDGAVKVPSLRNVALTAPYTHNGSFATLRDLVRFYSTRDVAAWPAPEVPRNVSTRLGDLGLTSTEIDAIVAFLRTLSDGYIR